VIDAKNLTSFINFDSWESFVNAGFNRQQPVQV